MKSPLCAHKIIIHLNLTNKADSFLMAYRASVWLFTSVPSHVYNQHVLRLERLLFSAALLPATDEHLFVGLDVILIDVL